MYIKYIFNYLIYLYIFRHPKKGINTPISKVIGGNFPTISGGFPTIGGRFPTIGGRNPSEIVVLKVIFYFDASNEENSNMGRDMLQ